MNNAIRKPIRAFCLTTMAALVMASTAVQAQTAMPMPADVSAPQVGMQDSKPGSLDIRQSMKAGMDGMHNMQMTGDTDKDFATMMKMHHQQALNMAAMELAHGNSAELKTMAKNIIAGQKKEIAQFDRWLAKQK